MRSIDAGQIDMETKQPGLSVDLQDQQAAIVEINRDRPIRIKDERDYPGRS